MPGRGRCPGSGGGRGRGSGWSSDTARRAGRGREGEGGWGGGGGGEREGVEQRHGSPSRATAEVEARLRRLLREPPDRTLVELPQGLGEAEGVHFSIQHLGRLLR